MCINSILTHLPKLKPWVPNGHFYFQSQSFFWATKKKINFLCITIWIVSNHLKDK